MPSLVIHPLTQQRLTNFVRTPSHALLIVGPAGIGKQSIAYQLTAELMNISLDQVTAHQYVRIVSAGKEKSIAIEKIRELEQFLSRKVPGNGTRVVLINDAHLLGTEAQNALLKTLEEPPESTTLILSVAHEQALLPTILSRAPVLSVLRPDAGLVKTYFIAAGYDEKLIARANAMSGGLPGLMSAILSDENDHPLVQAAGIARQIAQGAMFDRLVIVDGLSKDREQCLVVLNVLQQMARVSMRAGNMADSWQRILKGSHQAIGELQGSGQPKLVLTNLMLNL
ncbi:AAA family ATPase [Aeromicrobium sp.]|nr:AAA family ATPase [Candidatus Saccharibacteria bacterium]